MGHPTHPFAKEVSYKFDYETELLIVIGRTARNVSEADALNYVAGYCTSQDVSARDLQLECRVSSGWSARRWTASARSVRTLCRQTSSVIPTTSFGVKRY